MEHESSVLASIARDEPRTTDHGSRDAIRAVILARGSGDRLWPLSRQQRSKQFLRFSGESPLMEEIPVQLIEVQVGEYLEENDTERLEDSYGRG